MTQIDASAEMLSVRAFGRQMARELNFEEFEIVSEAMSPTANPEVGVMSSGWYDPPAC